MDDLLLRRVRVGLAGGLADVRVNDGRVAAIEEPGSGSGFAARVLDGHGGTVLPGLVDAHVHAVQWATFRRRIPLEDASSAADAVDLLLQRVLETGPSDLVVGAGFRDGLWPDKPHKDLLQRALPGRAVALFSADLHTLWLSPAALKLIGRDHPTGVLLENDCMTATAALPSAPLDVQDRWVADALEAAASRGVTGIVDYEYADTVADWTRRTTGSAPATRVACVISRPLLETAIARGHRTGAALGEGLLSVGPFKLFVDGSLNTRTAYCHDPYPESDSPGLLELPPVELETLMRRAWENGLVPAVHAIGDKANTIALDAFSAVGCPGRIEHAQLLSLEDVPRFAGLGLVASVQPAHQPDDRDVADRHWHGRTDRAYAYRALLDSGARLEIGSDAPVAPLDPWDGIAAAVGRTDDHRPAWHPEQAIPLADALAAASGGRRGVAVGDVADLMITAADPSHLSPAELRDMPLTATLLAGKPTHLA
ncbi:amidohydrolase family protein [Amycolatopsis rhabdoformis]|uniref:Amidohydrolase family protein n=1 Tax=Amycolatopsis rhabdoformis TaxID=1448059 RepID=A0ABZ1IKN1_9PSEU|nr:amidohydrolase family protein [Amycolatopsis rhabdoformis]WSE34977.1 amidohydrolase family protein [Amycolatopsis rhabdoformis]